MVKKILLVIILLPFLILALSPKKALLYQWEKQLATRGIKLADGVISTHPFGISIDHPSVYVKGIKIATLKHVSLWSALVYTKGTMNGITFDPSMEAYLPPGLAQVSLTHSIIEPTHVRLILTDKAFPGDGDVDLKKRTLKVRFTKLPQRTPMARYLKHTKGGWVYEQRF